MNKDEAYKKIQTIFNASPSPVIVLGSGASIPYGLASMSEISESLRILFTEKKYANPESNVCAQKILGNIGRGDGLERALLDVRATEEVENDIVENVWALISRQDQSLYSEILQGRELALTELFNRMVYGRREATINVVTTNYDRIAEYAASKTSSFINTGFSHSYFGVIKQSLDAYPTKLKESYTGKINIWKPHGSLDWFSKDGSSYYIPGVNSVPLGYRPCIITPGTNKYEKSSQEPHRSIMTHIDEVFSSASGFVCIGYGFNDIHIHPKLLQAAKSKRLPIMLVVKDITESIANNVTNDYDSIILSDNKQNGSIIQIGQETIEIANDPLWQLDCLCRII